MKKVKFVLVLGSVFLIAAFAAGCPKRTSIAEIESNPAKYQNKEVAVAGITGTSYGLSIPLSDKSGGIYKIDDGTGSIWVITDRIVPSKGSKLGVKGKIQNGISYNGKNYGLVLIESDRKFKKN
ncbi:MAG: hypothetical protein HKN25_05065 [Pyrinomonadaceae bacterium]|nr:hypothetical protein [Pyrinomonadaceae bacterium]